MLIEFLTEEVCVTMPTTSRSSTSDMEVTSIRFERELKDRLKQLAGNQGYQNLVRDILWDYVQQHSQAFQPHVTRSEIRASMVAIAQRQERCALTGVTIPAQTSMLLGLTLQGKLIPLSASSLD
jgi:metal-responsive CopG/Arc/MetJ family transcriptional regulator